MGPAATACTRNTMSKLIGPSAHPHIASKTAFAALDVDSGEDTEEDHITDQDSPSAERFVAGSVPSFLAVKLFVQCTRANKTDKIKYKESGKTCSHRAQETSEVGSSREGQAGSVR